MLKRHARRSLVDGGMLKSRPQVSMGTVLAVLLATAARADERLDHRGALGLSLSGGPLLRSISEARAESGVRAFGDVAVTFGIFGERVELMALGRIASGATVGTFVAAGIRSTFGYEHWKTFFDLNLAAGFTPSIAVGGRVAVGVQYDFVSVFGVFASIGGFLGGGQVLMLQGEFQVGVQFRTYVFDQR